MVAVINIRNLKTKTKGKNMQIQRSNGIQNPSMMPLDPKVEREEKGRNALTFIKDSIQNPHVCRNRYIKWTKYFNKTTLEIASLRVPRRRSHKIKIPRNTILAMI
jgi:hypothetical protein